MTAKTGARGLGANVYRTRFLVWVLAAFWTGLAGATYYLQQLRVQPAGTGGAFSVVQWTAPIIFIVVIGGIGTIEGPVIGAVLYYVLRDRFKDHQTVYLISMGAAGDRRRLATARWHLGNDPPQAGRRPVPRPPPPGRVALSSVWRLPGCLEGLHNRRSRFLGSAICRRWVADPDDG